MEVYVTLETDGSILMSVDGVGKSDFRDVIREMLYAAMSTQRKVKADRKDDIAFERNI